MRRRNRDFFSDTLNLCNNTDSEIQDKQFVDEMQTYFFEENLFTEAILSIILIVFNDGAQFNF